MKTATTDNQRGFCFETPLVAMPVSQLPPKPVLDQAQKTLIAMSGEELVTHLNRLSAELPDDIDYLDLLALAGFPEHAQTAWHRSRMLDALLPPHGEFQAYRTTNGGIRFRRLQPFEPCPGEICGGKPTRGGKLCAICENADEEDRFNTE